MFVTGRLLRLRCPFTLIKPLIDRLSANAHRGALARCNLLQTMVSNFMTRLSRVLTWKTPENISNEPLPPVFLIWTTNVLGYQII